MSPALCAQPGCQAEVDSLPAYMCADCGQRFCDEHLWINASGVEVCGRCYDATLARPGRTRRLRLSLPFGAWWQARRMRGPS
jgi:hypothetical protein